ncbi:unnamed protein product [Adineta steineri]|uniref:PKS/mFAS DH domain-containing protein n=1 Tax=Adineta steineri TaxID=433720 RepID=A0A819WN68_9BILA|nr:unnamed protein product [Adineta steineri]
MMLDSVEKTNGTKTSAHIRQFPTDHTISTTCMRPEHRSRFHEPDSLLYHFNLHGSNVSFDVTCSLSLEALHMAVQYLRRNEVDMAVCSVDHLVQMLLIMLKVKNDGLGLLLLKRLSDAECDALSSHNGNEDKLNFVVSSAAGQGRRFFNRSNLDPPLLLGLIKSNLGHTEGTAGIASLIKVAMYMYYCGITANMQFTSLNSKIDAQKYNLHILRNFLPFLFLPNNEKIAIGINSFRMGGTATHAIIEEYQPNKKTSIINAIFVFLNRQQLQEQINAFLTEQGSPGLSIISCPTKSLAQKICFVFSGEGPQLYESEPLFDKWINLIDGKMTQINKGEWRLLEELIGKKNEQESRINDTNIAQPTLFAIQVALTVLLVSRNIYPSYIISHSAGDQAAAFVAGRLSLEETVRMLAVSMSEEVQNKLLKDIEKDIRGYLIKDQEQIFNPICAQANLYSTAVIKDEAAKVFLEISPHPVLGTSIRECCELTNQQQQSPLILPTLKQKENKQITLLTSLAQLTTSSQVWQQYSHTRQILPLKNHEEYFDNFPLYKFHLNPCWYESKDSSIQHLANRIPTHPLLGIRQLNDQTSATWKSLININLPQHAFLKDHKIQDAILFPAVAYLELATAAYHQSLSSKQDDQQRPTIIFENYGSSFEKLKTLRGTSTTVICQLSNDNNNCSSYYLLYPYLVILPRVETTFLPVHIQKFIYSSKTKAKMNQSINIEVRGIYHDNICGIGQEGTYSLDLWTFPMDNKIEEPIFIFESIIIQQVQGAHSGRWFMEKTIYDKLNLTTDLSNVDHIIYLNTIIKDYCMKKVWT